MSYTIFHNFMNKYTNFRVRWKVCTTINMLSTPTANTKNGTTSIVSKVVVMPAYPQMPMEQMTEQRTITIPPTPRSILLSNCKKYCNYITMQIFSSSNNLIHIFGLKMPYKNISWSDASSPYCWFLTKENIRTVSKLQKVDFISYFLNFVKYFY